MASHPSFDLEYFNSMEPSFKDTHRKTFFQYGPYCDQKTVALCSLSHSYSGTVNNFVTMSGNKEHAEVKFIRKACLMLGLKPGGDVHIVMNMTKSPCWKCREELEDFFGSLKRKGSQVTFILRIANLYHGNGGSREKIIFNLAAWIYYLQFQGIVRSISLEPISVTEGLRGRVPRGVDQEIWGGNIEERRRKDVKIARTVADILRTNPIEQPVQQYQELRDLLVMAKRLFYRSTPSTPDVLVVGQIMVQAENSIGTKKSVVFKPIITNSGCCIAINKTFESMDIRKELPSCWRNIQINILLMSTHCPCMRCLEIIYDYLTRRDQPCRLNLTLRIANIRDSEESPSIDEVVDWMVELEEWNIEIRLEPISVTRELRVNKPRDETRQAWEKVKQERMAFDSEICHIVNQISSEKQRRQRPPWNDPAVDSLADAMARQNMS